MSKKKTTHSENSATWCCSYLSVFAAVWVGEIEATFFPSDVCWPCLPNTSWGGPKASQSKVMSQCHISRVIFRSSRISVEGSCFNVFTLSNFGLFSLDCFIDNLSTFHACLRCIYLYFDCILTTAAITNIHMCVCFVRTVFLSEQSFWLIYVGRVYLPTKPTKTQKHFVDFEAKGARNGADGVSKSPQYKEVEELQLDS